MGRWMGRWLVRLVVRLGRACCASGLGWTGLDWGEWDGLDGCFVKRGSLGVGLVVGGRIV